VLETDETSCFGDTCVCLALRPTGVGHAIRHVTDRLTPATSGVCLISAVAAFTDWRSGKDRVATASDDGTVRTFDADTGDLLLTVPMGMEPGARCLEAYEEAGIGARLVAGNSDGSIWVIDPQTGEVLHKLRENTPSRSALTTTKMFVGVTTGTHHLVAGNILGDMCIVDLGAVPPSLAHDIRPAHHTG
jgi:hypothetical protein